MSGKIKIDQYLNNSIISIKLTCINSGITSVNWPITISLLYVYMYSKIFDATQRSAKIVEYLSKNTRYGKVASYNPPYQGVIGYSNFNLDEMW